MPLLFLLCRALLPQKTALVSVALWISTLGVALGMIQLMLVLSVMTGFEGLFERNYTRITSEMIIIPKGEGEIDKRLQHLSAIKATAPFLFGQAMVLKDGRVGGVVLEGIDVMRSVQVTPWDGVWVEPPLEVKEKHWIWIGIQLAKKLNIKRGDTVDLMVSQGKHQEVVPFTVTAITKFGIHDHDLRHSVIDIGVLREIFPRLGAPMLKVRRNPDFSLTELAQKVRSDLEDSATVKLWNEVHQNIFLAVKHQKKLLFMVLEIICLLAAVNVVNLIMMSAQNRKRDFAILRAMGMRKSQVVGFFVAQGSFIGALGVTLGLFFGAITCGLAEKFQPSLLREEIYNVTRLPFVIPWGDMGLAAVIAFSLCVILSVLLAQRAAQESPVGILRYE